MMINRLTNGNECWQSIADDRNSQEAKPRLGEASQFKRQGLYFLPRHQAGQRASRKNRHRESAVLPIAGPDSFGLLICSLATVFLKVTLDFAQTVFVLFRCV